MYLILFWFVLSVLSFKHLHGTKYELFKPDSQFVLRTSYEWGDDYDWNGHETKKK